MAVQIIEPVDETSQVPFDNFKLNCSTTPTVDLLVVITIPGVVEDREYKSPISVLWESGSSLPANNRKYNGLCKILTVTVRC